MCIPVFLKKQLFCALHAANSWPASGIAVWVPHVDTACSTCSGVGDTIYFFAISPKGRVLLYITLPKSISLRSLVWGKAGNGFVRFPHSFLLWVVGGTILLNDRLLLCISWPQTNALRSFVLQTHGSQWVYFRDRKGEGEGDGFGIRTAHLFPITNSMRIPSQHTTPHPVIFPPSPTSDSFLCLSILQIPVNHRHAIISFTNLFPIMLISNPRPSHSCPPPPELR